MGKEDTDECIGIQMDDYARRSSGEFNSPLQWAGDIFDDWSV